MTLDLTLQSLNRHAFPGARICALGIAIPPGSEVINGISVPG